MENLTKSSGSYINNDDAVGLYFHARSIHNQLAPLLVAENDVSLLRWKPRLNESVTTFI